MSDLVDQPLLPDSGAPGPGEIFLDGLEVTQSIQTIAHSVTLIAGKRTVVRAYLSYQSGTPIRVRGELAVRRTAGGPVETLSSINEVTVDPAQNGQLRTKREDAGLSLNFALRDPMVAAGALFVSLASAVNVETGDPVPLAADGREVGVTFRDAPPLRVRIIGLRYRTGNPPISHVPSDLDFARTLSWLRRAYPVAEVIATRAIVDATAPWPFTCNRANAQISAIRNLDMQGGADPRTHYYGLVGDGGGFMRGCASVPSTPNPAAVGSGPAGPRDFGWDTDGSYADWYTGHELGHTFGRRHPGFCGETHDDLQFPYPNGQLSTNDGAFVGFDVGDPAGGLDMRALPGTQWHDVMTYCARQWLSAYTYEGIRRRLAAENPLGPGPSLAISGAHERDAARAREELALELATGRHINVVGSVNLTPPTGEILYVNPVSGVLSPAPPPGGPVRIRVLAGDGSVLAEHPAEVKVDSCTRPGEDVTGVVDATIPLDPAARAVELVVDGQTVDTFQAAGGRPAVRNLRRAPAGAESLALAWDDDAAADPKVTYNVQASVDGGRTWQTVALGSSTPEVTIDRRQFAGANRVQVRVIATDGFTSSVVTGEEWPADSL